MFCSTWFPPYERSVPVQNTATVRRRSRTSFPARAPETIRRPVTTRSSGYDRCRVPYRERKRLAFVTVCAAKSRRSRTTRPRSIAGTEPLSMGSSSSPNGIRNRTKKRVPRAVQYANPDIPIFKRPGGTYEKSPSTMPRSVQSGPCPSAAQRGFIPLFGSSVHRRGVYTPGGKR